MQNTHIEGECELFYEKELRFVCDFLKKCHISARVISQDDSFLEAGNISVFNMNKSLATINSITEKVKDETVYYLNDLFFCKYLFFLLPHHSDNKLLLIGPYSTKEINEKQIIEWAERHGVDAKTQKQIKEFYTSLPILSEHGVVFTVIETFLNTIWQKEDFASEEINPFFSEDFIAKIEKTALTDEEDAIIKMEAMEKRYKLENEMINAVINGQIHKTPLLFSSFSDAVFEKRVADQLRNLKNYAIIMNTLLRKAAEKGGVHPIYINSVSSNYAVKIEATSTNTALRNLMTEMFRDYCRLVRKHTMKNFSPPVQKTIVCIDNDLSADLSLNRLATLQNISPSYLSSIFKKETGVTVTEFVNNRRIKYAINLLENTKIQIQTVAQYSGIDDLNYFIRLFKKFTGMTPKQYRQNLLNNQM